MINRTLIIASLMLLIFSPQLSQADTIKYGTLKVITDNESAEIYIDGGLAGRSIVTIEDIQAGSHYIKIISGKKTIYDKIITIQEGQQETIVAKSKEEITEEKKIEPGDQSQYPHLEMPFGISVTYGGYNATLSMSGLSSSFPVQGNCFGLGIKIIRYLKESKNTYYAAGFHFNAETGPTQISYVYIDVGMRSEIVFSEIGINYSMWQNRYLSINSNIGYQIALGINLTDNFSTGVKYAIFNGSGTYSGYPYDISFAQTMVFATIH